MRSAPIALFAGLLTALPEGARACLNDFEISVAEQQLRGAYAAPAMPAGDSAVSVAMVLAALGGLALLAALTRALRAA